jgi:hypothetical protein
LQETDVNAPSNTTIDILEPGHPEYTTADFVSSDYNSTEFYNSVADAYNAGLEVGSIAFIPMPEKLRPFNFKKCIFGRGLEDGIDVVIANSPTDASGRLLPPGEKVVKMKKLSDTLIRKVGAS